MLFVSRIVAVILRHLRLAFRDFQHLSMLFYWPLIDIILFGFTASWMQSGQPDAAAMNQAVLTCVVLWQVLTRVDLAISFGLLDELWAHNVVNLFGSPLRIGEWITAMVAFALFMSFGVLAYCTGVAQLIYGINVLHVGLMVIPVVTSLFISGVWMGHFAAACLVYFGPRVQTMVWMTQWFLAPFIGVFYPVDILPVWVQKFSYSLPMTYAFEAIRDMIIHGVFNGRYLLISFGLNFIYTVAMLGFFMLMFRQSKNKGLARLID